MSAHTNVNNLSFTYANHLKYIQKVQKYKMQAKFDLKKKPNIPPSPKVKWLSPNLSREHMFCRLALSKLFIGLHCFVVLFKHGNCVIQIRENHRPAASH